MNDNADSKPATMGGAVVHFMDGSKAEYIFTRDDDDAEGIAQRLELMFKTGMLCMHMNNGRLTVIPTHNIRRIDLNPAPPSLPDGVIRNVREA